MICAGDNGGGGVMETLSSLVCVACVLNSECLLLTCLSTPIMEFRHCEVKVDARHSNFNNVGGD